jgi:perosamine synthetase
MAALRDVLPAGDGPMALHEPWFGSQAWDCVRDALDSGWVSSCGPYVERFEAGLAERLEVGHVVACVSGTAALHICLRLAGVEPGDEVVVPALTFVATANAGSYCGAVPHLADSQGTTLGLDPVKLADHLAETLEPAGCGSWRNRLSGRRLAAILPVHVFGHPVDMDPLLELAARYGLPVVEDAAEALGSHYKGRAAGALGQTAALSFNGNKIITSGGGGAIVTRDPALAARARHLTTTAKLPHAWEYRHDEVAYNYRLPNLNAALGYAQLADLSDFLAAKRALAARYQGAFAAVAGAEIFVEPAFAESNYWLNALLLDPEAAHRRDSLLAAMHEGGVLARPAWTLLHRLPMYADCPRMDLSVSEDLERRLINLPSSAALSAPPARNNNGGLQ